MKTLNARISSLHREHSAGLPLSHTLPQAAPRNVGIQTIFMTIAKYTVFQLIFIFSLSDTVDIKCNLLTVSTEWSG